MPVYMEKWLIGREVVELLTGGAVEFTLVQRENVLFHYKMTTKKAVPY